MLYKAPKSTSLININTGPKWERRLRWMYIFFAWNAFGGVLYLKFSGKAKKMQEMQAYKDGTGERTGKEELELEKYLSSAEKIALIYRKPTDTQVNFRRYNWRGQEIGAWTLEDTKKRISMKKAEAAELAKNQADVSTDKS